MLDVIKTRNFWFVVSGIILAAGILALAIYGLNLGVDFKGGSLAQVKIASNPDSGGVQDFVNTLGHGNSLVQKNSLGNYNIRTGTLTEPQHQELLGKLKAKYGAVEELEYTSIGPTISGEITRRAFYQLILVTLGILAYIAFAFRRVPRPLSSWRFGWAAVVALIHDLFVVVGIFAILGHFLRVEIDALFVTALLTVLGFSVHDTIIVFDRIRENLRRLAGQPFDQVVARSINQTLVRSINTSSTVVIVLLAMLLFGGESIRYFVLALLIGIVAGTYSSIFIASPLLYVWHRKKFVR